MKFGFLLMADKMEPGTKINIPHYTVMSTNPVSVEIFPRKSPEIGVTRSVVESIVVQTNEKHAQVRKETKSRTESPGNADTRENDDCLRDHLIKVVQKLRKMEQTGK